VLAEKEQLPVYEDLEKNCAPVDYIAGGATQNSIRVAAWMGKRKMPCAYSGCVGDDSYAGILKERCEAAGVKAHYMVDASTPTGKCACLIHEKERALITDLQAANNFKLSHLETEESQALISAAQIIYCAGFFLTSGGTACTTFLGKACAEGGKRFCLNISAPFIAEFFTSALDETMPYIDILFGNETEAAALGKVKGWGEDVVTFARKAASLPKESGTHARMVVITQGAKATVVAFDGAVTEYPTPELDSKFIVDTNGAGDSFVGGFLLQLARGRDIAACVAAGNFAARTIIQRSGCTMPETCDFEG